ncbi:disease resistance protein RGA5-like [Triticum dicoccoides]|uniref:disease resistance protein RGA5-like n=1 Tax=Triticum dicoccoides TaxID=85692 RepID=UPI00188FD8F1|nr:disease resistance protein RGA5-like [Triticum dicoccoides]
MEAAMIPLIKKLRGLLANEYNLEKRVRKGVKSLITELEMMHAVLSKIGTKPAEQLDEQDAVDGFLVRVEDVGHDHGSNNMKNRVKKFLKRATKLFTKGKALHQISNDIEEAQWLSQELGDLRQKYMSDADTKGNGDAIDPRLKAVYKDVTELVGIDHIRDELIEKLCDGNERSKDQLRTMSIVGFGGLGKTTLAKAVYDKIKVQFDSVAFVSVSRTPDMTKIFKKILYELDKSKYATINEAARDHEQLLDELRNFLQDKRYLIVIDDIWDEEAWGLIKCVFSNNYLGSRVMTTTRIGSISEACCSSGDDIIYQMKPLTDDHSKRLFYKRIFPQGIKCPDELEKVSREILKKCGGVPLAIITIASILASNGQDQQIKPKYQWDNILGSIGRGLAGGGGAKDMQRILSFSYYDLPSHLKTCLLYLSIFPEDFEIRRDRLIWMWIAEGFVQGGEQETGLFELGESYFNELANRNLIQPVHVDATDAVLPVGIGNLTSLEELTGKLVDVKELGQLVKLRVLYLCWNGSDESVCNSLVESLSKLQKMQSLTIFGCAWRARSDVSWDGFVPTPQLRYLLFTRCTTTLPRWVNSSLVPLLSYMHVSVDRVRPEVDIQILGRLPTLRYLFLSTNKDQHTRVETFVVGANAFPCLRVCEFFGFLTGPSMFPRGAMPRLEILGFRAEWSDIASGELDVGMGHTSLPFRKSALHFVMGNPALP